jgi:cobalamin biosynthesis Mg chelatase CobN
MPATEQKTSWQQLDTTFCMRILLDPEKDAAHPLDLLGNMPRPGSARRACNAIRTARNEAAHAADRAGAIEAALRFNEAIECLEEGYVGLALSEADISRYYRTAEEYMARCKGERPKAAPQASTSKKSTAKQRTEPEINVYPTGRAREQAAAARSAAGKNAAARGGEKGTSQRKSAPGRSASATRSSPVGAKRKKAGRASARRKKGEQRINKLFVALAFLVLALGLFLRARTMGIF